MGEDPGGHGDLAGADGIPGEDVATLLGDDREVGSEVDARVVAACVDTDAAGPRDIAEHAEAATQVGPQDRGAGEPIGDDRVVKRERDDLGHLGSHPSDEREVWLPDEPRVPDGDPAAQQPVPGHSSVVPQQFLAQPLGVDVGDPEADVVGDHPEVGDVVIEPLQLEQERPPRSNLGVDRDAEGLLDCLDERDRVPDRRVAADPLGQLDCLGRQSTLEQPLHAAVDEPQPGLHPQDGLADHREPEVPRLDDARVDRADWDLIYPVALDMDERIGPDVGLEIGHRAGVAQHRVPGRRPVSVPDQPSRQRVPDRLDPEQVAQLALESPCGIRQPGEAGQLGLVMGEAHDELAPLTDRP